MEKHSNLNKLSIFIVIPCYNEGEVISETVKELNEFNYKVIIVDDGSHIDVEKYLSGLDYYYMRHIINLGQGAALQTGMDFAYAKGADIVIHFDADGQHNPLEIQKMIYKLMESHADIVLGSRFLVKDHVKKVPVARRMLLRMARVVNGLFTGLWLTDAHNGFRCLNRVALEKIKITENRMAHATEILQLIKKNKLKYAEVPTQIIYTEYSMKKGQSALNSVDIFIDMILNIFK